MDAVLCHDGGHAEMVDHPMPQLLDGTAIIGVSYCGLCATDLEILAGGFWGSYPVIPGHEISGAIVELDESCDSLKVGQQVAVDPNKPCGECDACRRGLKHLCEKLRATGVTEPGGFAEFVRVPLDNVHPIPDTVSADVAALSEPLACVLHGIDQADVATNDTIQIHGAGFIGLLFAQALHQLGAKDVVFLEPSIERVALAKELGYQVVANPITASLSIDCSGHVDAIASAIRHTRPGGRILLFGVPDQEAKVPLSPYVVFRKELTIVGSFINPDTQRRAVDLLPHLQLEALITHRFPLSKFTAAVKVKRQDPRALKILIHPN